jgi:large subunit ribosomal protein L9
MSKNVKLLLKQSIKNVGRVGDVVEVSAGYARNYLLPQELAVTPTPGNVKKVEAIRQDIERRERERREQMEALLKQLQGVEVTLERKCNEQGHLYGAVSATDIAKGLQAQNFNVEPDDINLPGRLDHIDTYMVRIRFTDDLSTEIKVWVAPDSESKAAMEAAKKAAAPSEEAPQA